MLLAASFPPAIGGIETLLYQTSRRLAEPPTVVAPPPAAAPDLDVRWAPSTPGMRLVYRPLWAMHPSLHFLQTFWAPAMRLARAAQPRVVMAGHVYLAPMARLLARRLHV